MSPPSGSGDILSFPVRLSVRHKTCPLYNLKTVKDFSMNLGTLVDSQVSDRCPWATCLFCFSFFLQFQVFINIHENENQKSMKFQT